MESRVSRRRQQYRKVWDDARPKREHQQEQIRKQIRDENLAKRRYMQNENTDPAVPGGAESAGAADPIGDQAVPAQFGQDQVMHFMQNLLSPDPQIRVESTQHFRKILSVESNPPIDAVIAAGAVPYFVEFLKCSDFKDLQFEAAWCLTNIASGTNQQTQTVVSHGLVQRGAGACVLARSVCVCARVNACLCVDVRMCACVRVCVCARVLLCGSLQGGAASRPVAAVPLRGHPGAGDMGDREHRR
eukprot:GHVU01226132.1.p1 GENE.GHVU01226132.1~~GHVU01226132.1.p1  ORF type:complete len:245 (+),score=25.42 GHVU01226132.1:711-1445(+)